MIPRTVQTLSFFTALWFCGLSPVSGQQSGDPLLEEVKQRRVIEAQRLEREITRVNAEATQIGRTNPEEALRILRQALTVLEKDSTLAEETRASLIRKITLGVRAYEARTGNQHIPTPVIDPARIARENARIEEFERQRGAQADINRTLQEIDSLRRSGHSFAAQRLEDDLRRRHPGNSVVGVGSMIGRTKDIRQQYREADRLKNEALVKVDLSTRRSMANITEDITFPAREEWERISKRLQTVKLTPAERKILTALNAPLEVDYRNETFGNVLKHLETIIGEPIIAHRDALAEVGASYDSTVNLQTQNKVSTRTILKKVLADLGLVYVIKDQTIQVTSPLRARDMLTTRVYPISDLVQLATLQAGPFGQFQTAAYVNQIINMIQSTIEPSSWQAGGGPGTIRYDPITQSLVVRNSAEIHFMLGVGLR